MSITLQKNASRPSLRGFTLLEVLLVLAIMALIGSVLIGGTIRLLNDQPVSVDDMFWKSVQEARKGALRHQREVRLQYIEDHDKGKLFVVTDGDLTKEFPIPVKSLTQDLQVDFLATQKGGPSILVAGMLLDTQPVKNVTFYPDGTCTSFKVQIVRNGATHQLAIDPWTCAQVLNPPDPYRPR
jgi:prepilin-type N-terminal cleavage/methylation domain-containing protein